MKEFDEFEEFEDDKEELEELLNETLKFKGEREKIEPETSIVWLIANNENWKGKTVELTLIAGKEFKELSSDGKEKISWLNVGYEKELDRYVAFFVPQKYQRQLNEYEGGIIELEISEDGKMNIYRLGRLDNEKAKKLANKLVEEFKTHMIEMMQSESFNYKTYEKIIRAFGLEDFYLNKDKIK